MLRKKRKLDSQFCDACPVTNDLFVQARLSDNYAKQGMMPFKGGYPT
jgi:hypothetical protein